VWCRLGRAAARGLQGPQLNAAAVWLTASRFLCLFLVSLPALLIPHASFLCSLCSRIRAVIRRRGCVHYIALPYWRHSRVMRSTSIPRAPLPPIAVAAEQFRYAAGDSVINSRELTLAWRRNRGAVSANTACNQAQP